jgi:hypothetical protein
MDGCVSSPRIRRAAETATQPRWMRLRAASAPYEKDLHAGETPMRVEHAHPHHFCLHGEEQHAGEPPVHA